MRGVAVSDTRVLIVEDEVEVREEYKRLMKEKYPGLCLAGETDDVQDALRMIQNMRVDAVILDLELGGDHGLRFLKCLRESRLEKPFILAVTKVTSKEIHNTARDWGADSICVKGGTNFMLDHPLAIIEIVTSCWETRGDERVYADELNARGKKELYKKGIQDTLEEMGFPSKNQGTNQCVDALLYMVLSGQEEISITKQVYPYVAYIYNTGKSNVEVNIRKSIERVWLCEYEQKLRQWYPYDWNHDTGRPTNAEFLINMAKKWMK